MRIFGELCLLVSFVGSGYAAFGCLMAKSDRWAPLARSSRAAAVGSFLALSVTFIVLAWALATRDFDFEYVAQYTSQSLSWHYSLSALWVGQAGSLLLWTWLLALLSMMFLALAPTNSRLHTTAFGMLLANIGFLTAVMIFAADPMKATLTPRSEGLGLSPLLQHPSMLIHPPVVFLAYAGWAVPFALATAALLTGELDSRWTQSASPWALFSWTVLGTGLLLGAHWAYQELGWGGYWGWDPVENGSLLPWLTGTALIHTLMAWRHRGCFKRTALALAIATFGLCNFATFLTRSGVFSSVHAFSQSPIGWMFLGLMGLLLASGAALVFWRRRELGPERPIGSLLARESLVLISVCLLLMLTAVVFTGTVYVPLSQLVVGHMVQIGPAFYNNVLMPIGILLLAATAAVPLARWGAAPRRAAKWALLVCGAFACGAVIAAAAAGAGHPVAILIAGLVCLVVCTAIAGFGIDLRRHGGRWSAAGMLPVLRKNRRQYAGYFIHLAVASLAVGITGSSLGTQRHEAELDEGDVIEWAGRRIEYVRLIQREEADKLVAEVELRVGPSDGKAVELKPARHFHLLQEQWTTEVAVHSTWYGDFYTILNAGLGEGRVVVTLVENPMMRWIWLSGWLAGSGAIVAAWPTRASRREQGGQLGAVWQLPTHAAGEHRRAA
jgi:cytochrome c-type biogenesis protein CcmF